MSRGSLAFYNKSVLSPDRNVSESTLTEFFRS